MAYVQFVDGRDSYSPETCTSPFESSVPHESTASLRNIGWFDCGDSRKIHDFQNRQLRIGSATTLFGWQYAVQCERP
jgi:hypothetical protein